MRVLFICSSLESGKDGVGDYTALFASKLIKHYGYDIFLISIFDKHIKELEDFSSSKQVVRVPADWAHSKRFFWLQKIINQFNPTLISLQYVNHGYHIKGLPVYLLKGLGGLDYEGQWHIMFHELWVGHQGFEFSKNYLIGYLQRGLIKRLVKILNPDLITTNTEYYQFLLKINGVNAKILPLISNFEEFDITYSESIKIIQDAIKKSQNKNIKLGKNTQIAVIFGSIPVRWNWKEVIEDWSKRLNTLGEEGILLIAGKNGIGSNEIQQSVCADCANMECYKLGMLDAIEVSALMKIADLGFSPTPYVIREKSGVIAVMRQHGVPVIINKIGNYHKQFEVDKSKSNLSGIYLNTSDTKINWEIIQRTFPNDNSMEIVEKFIDELN